MRGCSENLQEDLLKRDSVVKIYNEMLFIDSMWSSSFILRTIRLDNRLEVAAGSNF